ncbi:MAG: ferrochelatase [Planctomycetota bacterium]|nr:MAG: ferrochelatase [Planctomycetota bacterium]
MTKTAVLLQQLGGPSAENEVQPFLENLFSDPELFRIPLSRWLQKPFARAFSKRRAPSSAKKYLEMGGFPLLPYTRAQAEGLTKGLAKALPQDEFLVRPAMRYWQPFIREALEEAREWGAERVLSFTLYPQFSTTTTGSSERQMQRELEAMAWEPELRYVSDYHAHPKFIDCLVRRVEQALRQMPAEQRQGCLLLFSAHGTPMSYVRAGDPYVARIQGSVDAVLAQLTEEIPHRLVFQSRVGPVKWTSPYLDKTLESLPSEGITSVLILPIAFVSDHLETLHEIDIEAKEDAERAGIQHFARTQSLNADPDFLNALTEIAKEQLQ